MLKVPRFRLSLNIKLILTACKGLMFCNRNTVSTFEGEFKKYIGVREAVAVGSATIAQYLVLKHLNFPPGSEIIISAYILPDVINMIICNRLKPVIVDIDLETFNFDIQDFKRKISKNTKAVIVTHLYGYVGEMETIQNIAKENILTLIEDCAQACGAKFNDKRVGTIGHASFFSFSSYKNLTTFGGGMITTNSSDLAKKIRQDLEDYTIPTKVYLIKKIIKDSALWFFTTEFIFNFLTFNILKLFGKRKIDKILSGLLTIKTKRLNQIPQEYRMKYSDIQAKVGLIQLKMLEENTGKRIKNATSLNEGLKRSLTENNNHIYLYYPYITKKNHLIKEKLFEQGIDTVCGNLPSCHTLEIFKEFYTECKNAEFLYGNLIYLPIYPPINKSTLLKIIDIVNNS